MAVFHSNSILGKRRGIGAGRKRSLLTRRARRYMVSFISRSKGFVLCVVALGPVCWDVVVGWAVHVSCLSPAQRWQRWQWWLSKLRIQTLPFITRPKSTQIQRKNPRTLQLSIKLWLPAQPERARQANLKAAGNPKNFSPWKTQEETVQEDTED